MNMQKNIFSAASNKLSLFPEKLDNYLDKKNFVPIATEVQPSEKCNHKCPSCQSYYALEKRDVHNLKTKGSFLDFNKLDTFWNNPPDGVIISGHTGEPLMHPEIDSFLVKLEEKKIPAVLITNGSLITEKIALLAVKACRGIRISLDSYDHSSFMRAHGMNKDSWETVLKGITQLMKVREKTKKVNCSIGIGYLTDETTQSGMVAATKLAMKIGVDYIQFRPFHFKKSDISKELGECNDLARSGKIRILSSDQKYSISEVNARPYSSCHGAFFIQ
ncbi:radical SAM protein [Patescibacteria group bacterium]